MSKKLSQTPKNAAIVEKITTFSSRLASKNYGQKYNAKDREVSRAKIPICPLLPLAIDTHTITVKRDGIHTCILFHKNIEFTRDAKNSLFHPAYEITSSNPTNHSSASARNTRCPLWSALDLRDGYFPPHPTNRDPTSARSTRCPFWRALVLRDPSSMSITHDFPGTTRNERYHSKFHPRRE